MKIVLYAHGSEDSNREMAKGLGLSESARNTFERALYEVKFDCELDPETGEAEIVAVNGVPLAKPVPA